MRRYKLEEKDTEEFNGTNEAETTALAEPAENAADEESSSKAEIAATALNGAVTEETGKSSFKDTLNSLKGRPFKEKVNILWHDKRVRFLFVGVLNTLVGYGSTFIMYLIFNIDFRNTEAADPTHVFICTLTGQILGMVNSYFFNKYFTFRSKKKSLAETVRFCIVCGVQYAVNYFGTLLTFNVLHWYKILSMLAVAVVSTLVSYFGHNLFTFGKYFYKNKKADAKENNNESIK